MLERFEIPVSRLDPPVIERRPEWARTPPGWYSRLRRGHEVFMTDTHDEWWTQRIAIDEARWRGGKILITGLGLGLIVEEILADSPQSATRITVIEKSPDVIRLVGPHLQQRFPAQLEIVCADAYTWMPPEGIRYSVVWHDIWPNPKDPACASEIDRLQQRYARWCDWQGSWTLPE